MLLRPPATVAAALGRGQMDLKKGSEPILLKSVEDDVLKSLLKETPPLLSGEVNFHCEIPVARIQHLPFELAFSCDKENFQMESKIVE